MLHLDEAAWRWRPLRDPKEAKLWSFEARSLTSLSDEYLFTQYFPSWVLQTQTRKGSVCLHIVVERGTCAGHMDKRLEMLKYKDCLIQKNPHGVTSQTQVYKKFPSRISLGALQVDCLLLPKLP